jgi:alpha-glucan, water dikinase
METIETAGGVVLRASVCTDDTSTTCLFEQESGPACVLHWGLLRADRSPWRIPPRQAWPEGTKAVGGALQTPFVVEDGRPSITLRVDSSWGFAFVEFALFDPATSRWDNNRGRNFRMALPLVKRPGPTPMTVARGLSRTSALSHEAVHALDEGFELAVVACASEDRVEVVLATDLEGPLFLHWGVAGASRSEWRLPTPALRPPGTLALDERAVQTPFVDQGGLRHLRFCLSGPEPLPRALCFVLFQKESRRWWKNRGHNFFLPLQNTQARGPLQDPNLAEIAEEIIERETGDHSWSLMHRFDLAFELLDRIPLESPSGLALLFVWLRYSALRQLDWQRRYNTKPRELAHAQDRLTLKLSERYASASATRPLLRLIATTLGRGNEGQRVRDGILEIMHRHHIKEVAGHFLEEWHQKLHNNTTPDDVVIAEAYLEFLRHFGDLRKFYATLEARGVSRERLTSYERPIRSAPDFIPHLRDVLLRDFGDFLGVLRSVHAATDLGTAIVAARPWLDEPIRHVLDVLWRRRDEAGAETWVLKSLTKLREVLAGQLHQGRAGLRELLYLDLALEDALRAMVERNLQLPLPFDQLLAWTELAVRGLHCSRPTEDLSLGLRHLQRLWALPHAEREWALHAQAVLERIRRELIAMVDGDARLLQPVAEYLGQAVGAADWSVRLFSEEVVRGRIEFVVSTLLRKLDEVLRRSSGLGRWQVVSRGRGQVGGVVEGLASLAGVQGRRFEARTILIVDEINGDEDIPEGVTAVLTKSTVDLVSHVGVRARNAGVLLATCWDGELLTELLGQRGEWVRLLVDAVGDLTVTRGEPMGEDAMPLPAVRTLRPVPKPGLWALTPAAFRAENVGAKALNLQRLAGRLPDWIHLPASVALPFGVCERVLDDPGNQAEAEQHQALLASLAKADRDAVPVILARLRDGITRLAAPSEVKVALRAAMGEAGLPLPDPWPEAWRCITQVWASKWNERAYWNRRSNGIADEGLLMAVLVQGVIAADYAFVVHTANPMTGDRDELLGELVSGLGETLVGNHPGRAMGFLQRRGETVARIVSFPSKSLGLYGHGHIFRSDSNGEDLLGFAGAGLYDSVMLPPGHANRIDYTGDELLWNEKLRNQILTGVARIGAAVEAALGGPQDIEGVWAQGRFFVVQARPQVGLEHG